MRHAAAVQGVSMRELAQPVTRGCSATPVRLSHGLWFLAPCHVRALRSELCVAQPVCIIYTYVCICVCVCVCVGVCV